MFFSYAVIFFSFFPLMHVKGKNKWNYVKILYNKFRQNQSSVSLAGNLFLIALNLPWNMNIYIQIFFFTTLFTHSSLLPTANSSSSKVLSFHCSRWMKKREDSDLLLYS